MEFKVSDRATVTTRVSSMNTPGAAQERISGIAPAQLRSPTHTSTNIAPLPLTSCLFNHPSVLGINTVRGVAPWLMRCHDDIVAPRDGVCPGSARALLCAAVAAISA